VCAPGLGDDVQAIKAGLLEIADVLVVNKVDLPHAEVTAAQLRNMLKLRETNLKNIPIVMTSATLDQGLDDLCGSIERSVQKSPQEKQRLHARRMQRLIAQTAAALTRRMVLECPPDQIAAWVSSAIRGKSNLEEAAMRMLKELFQKLNDQIDLSR
jgi:LAO/AO transport system kinase